MNLKSRQGIAGKSLLRLSMAAAALGLGTAASAQLYKCSGEGGKTSYSDHPCDATSKQTDVEGDMTGRVPAIRYYELYSTDWQGMRAELERKGHQDARGQRFHGMASWKVGYTYRWSRQADGQCRVTGVTPTFEGEIRMPRWVPGASVPAAQRKEWERYAAALKLHEDGHIANGRRLASAIAQLSGMQVDCGAVDATIRQRFDALLRQYNAADAEYDRATGHGATQGASLQ